MVVFKCYLYDRPETSEGFSQQDSNAIRESLQTTNMVNFIRLVKVSIHNQIHKGDHWGKYYDIYVFTV